MDGIAPGTLGGRTRAESLPSYGWTFHIRGIAYACQTEKGSVASTASATCYRQVFEQWMANLPEE